MLFLRSYHKKTAGFSLLEVLITAAIIGIITTIALVRYSSFNNVILLKNQAFELALDLREAQTFAISVRGDGGEFRQEYGISFDRGSNPGQYILFQDADSAALPAYNAGEEIVGPIIIDSRFELSDICINDETTCGIDRLDATFRRPNFDAMIRAVVSGVPVSAYNARIVLANVIDPTGTVSVLITSTGQILVE